MNHKDLLRDGLWLMVASMVAAGFFFSSSGPPSIGLVSSAEPTIPVREKRPYGIAARTTWTTSRLTGSPEPPPPYRTERVFPKVQFKNPLAITSAPGTKRLFVAEQAGKLYSVPNDPDCDAPDLFLDLPKEIQTIDPAGPAKSVGDVYGLAFHPQFEQNRYCYICYTLQSKTLGQELSDGTRVSRFRVTETDPPRCEPASERVLITWLAGGHNGGCLAFGPDGCLYISTGDGAGPSPPDPLDAGQDVSNLLSAILRIDVDHADGDKPYTIPPDNPFVALVGHGRIRLPRQTVSGTGRSLHFR